jgi:ATP phosphoribosyltransferase
MTMGYTNGLDGGDEVERIAQRARQGSRSLPFMTDLLGNSLNDRLLFAVPKSTSPASLLAEVVD